MRDQQASHNLWRRFVAGDESAFAELYDHYFSPLYYYGYKIVPDDALIEDCLHDFFLYLYNSRQNFAPVQSLDAYLYRSFRRLVLRHVEKAQKAYERQYLYARLHEDADAGVEHLWVAAERQIEAKTLLTQNIAALPPRQKEILHLKYFDNFSYDEIAEITQLSYQTVVNHLNKAINKLRKAYAAAGMIAANILFWLLAGLA